MHGLNCAICGKEYFYESKICHECEEYAIYSGLAKTENFVEETVSDVYIWNCSGIRDKGFLSLIRSSNKKIYFCITQEPRNYKSKNSDHYFWNPESAIRLQTCLEESIERANLNLEPKLVDDVMNFLKN
ncbi:MAG: hypothetical protein P8Y23_06175 [Candidatus Lokiarchaeota archaeon]